MRQANSFLGIVAAIVAAILAVGAAIKTPPPPPGAVETSAEPELLASDLIGRPVSFENGAAVGRIADLVLSPTDKGITGVVVSVGGFLDLSDRRVEVPYGKLVVAADRGAVLVMMSEDEIVATPEFERRPEFVRKKEGAFLASTP